MKFFTYIFIIYIYLSTSVSADTMFTDTAIFKDTILLKSKSPYIVDKNITIRPGVIVTIEEGVKVVFDQGSFFFNASQLSGKNFEIEFRSNPSSNRDFLLSCSKCILDLDNIQISSLPQSFISAWDHSTVILKNTNVSFVGNVESTIGVQVFNNSILNIDNSSFTRFSKALDIFNFSSSTITNSFFGFNTHAIYTFDSNLDANHNDFEGNRIGVEFFTSSNTSYTVHVEHNWWGSVKGPVNYSQISEVLQNDINPLVGGVLFTPWSLSPHRKTEITGVSNILFLPGLMGSRLYKKEIFENQLWEPNRNKDVSKLYLDSSGNSIEKNIYTRDIIYKTNIAGGLSMIEETPYKDFSVYMDGLVKNNIIQTWKSAPYDWRYSPDTILEQGTVVGNSKSTTVSNLVDEVVLLAKTSKTKKVTLVTHSNGGLVGKQLMIELKNKNLDMLVDKIIFVAMPEFGTPQAITSLLYGHEQSIAGGLILNASVAKKLGINMPTAYTLLPSEKYFNSNSAGIQIDDVIVKQKNQLNTTLAEKSTINSNLLYKADNLHAVLDNWIPPSYVDVYQIVGTGLLTVSGLAKDSKGKSLPKYTTSGDGIVQDMYNKIHQTYPRTGTVFAVDLHDSKFKHMNIMNSGGTMKYLDTLIRKSSEDTQALLYKIYPTYSDKYILFNITASSTSLKEKTIEIKTTEGKDILRRVGNSQFDLSNTQDMKSRYDLFGVDMQYISQESLQNLQIFENTGDTLNLNIFQVDTVQTIETAYKDIKLFPGSGLSLNLLNITSANPTPLEIVLPMLNQKIQIFPSNNSATVSEDFETKITRIRNTLMNSNVTTYVKIRYLRRLDTILKSKNTAALHELQQKSERSVVAIHRLVHNPQLRSRYTKLKQDYMYLSYVLQ